jgi:putative ABC transport system permease protein
VMINEAMAKRHYAGVDPIGKMISWNATPHWRIIGVVGTSRLDKMWEEAMPVLYVPVTQAARRGRHFVIRSDLPSADMLAAARTALRQVDPMMPLTDPASMEERIETSLGPQRFRALLMASLGGLALLLAVVGVYGVVANAVTSRTREIGIRMALGEARAEVGRRVLGDAMRVAAIGVVAGMGLALAAGKWLAVFLIDVSPHDTGLLAGAAIALAALVAVAALGPARRAAGVDPIVALRSE